MYCFKCWPLFNLTIPLLRLRTTDIESQRRWPKPVWYARKIILQRRNFALVWPRTTQHNGIVVYCIMRPYTKADMAAGA